MNKVVIFGIGLIGASFARALKTNSQCNTIIGIDLSLESIDYALKNNIITETASIKSAMNNADLVLLAIPVAQTENILNSIYPYLERKTLIIDTGSTKIDVINAANFTLKDKVNQFIPCHPIAGKENSGPEFSSADLYFNKKIILTPLNQNSKEDLLFIELIWKSFGSEIQYLSPKEHDSIFSSISHLPHLLSYAFINDLSNKPNMEILLKNAGSGFRDFTRLASSSPEMWSDISISNKEALIKDLDSYINQLISLRSLLKNNDKEGLKKMYENSRNIRSNWEKE